MLLFECQTPQKKKILNIMEDTNTNIDFEKESDTLTIRGLEKNVKEAKKLVNEYIYEIVNSPLILFSLFLVCNIANASQIS